MWSLWCLSIPGPSRMESSPQTPVLLGVGAGSRAVSSIVNSPLSSSQNLHINSLELVAIMVAIQVWGPTLRGKCVTFSCNNQSSVQVINRGFTDDAHTACLREITYRAAVGEFAVWARHLARVQNKIANLLSRWELMEGPMLALQKLAPNVKLCEVQVPPDYFQPQELW